jgi:DNA-binding CsgD family transcriptional regulator/tetratricopeptide (TPR) repeat protein
MTRLEREHANLLAALDWLAAHPAGNGELRIAVALSRFWRSRGYPHEGLRCLEGALSRADAAAPALRMLALDGAGYFAQQFGADEQAAARHEEALALARSLGDERQVALALNNLGVLATSRRDEARAAALLEESLAFSRRLGDTWATALTLYKLAVLVETRGDRERAAGLLRESLAAFRELGDQRSVAVVLTALASHVANARDLLEEGLALCRELGDRAATLYALMMTIDVVAQRVTPECLARLLGAVDGLREAMAIDLSRNTAPHYARAEAIARAALDEAAYAAAWDIGHALPLAAIIDDALAAVREAFAPPGRTSSPAATRRSGPALTRREREVLGLLANGLSNQDIARELSIGERTARFHVTSILGKLGVRTRGQAVAVAMRQSLIR